MKTAERQGVETPAAAAPDWMHGLLGSLLTVNTHIRCAKAAPLTGGVSSDVYRVDVAGRTLCVKRALPKLKVAADWQVPVDRNASEAAWLRAVADIVPDAVPSVLAGMGKARTFEVVPTIPPTIAMTSTVRR